MSTAQKIQHDIFASFLVLGVQIYTKYIIETTVRIKEIEFDNLTMATVPLSQAWTQNGWKGSTFIKLNLTSDAKKVNFLFVWKRELCFQAKSPPQRQNWFKVRFGREAWAWRTLRSI